jgi:hypothetical protein
VWIYDMGATTCSHCSAYGTGRCGVQSWLVALLWKRKSVATVSRLRARLHFCFDILMMVVGIVVFSLVPIVLPFFLLWLAVGWWIVHGPKKHHGLLPLLRKSPNHHDRGVLRLPVRNVTP